MRFLEKLQIFVRQFKKNPFKGSNLFLIIAFIGLLIVLTQFKSFVIFLFISILAGILNYFIHISGFHIHLGLASFLAVIFGYSLGWGYALLSILIAHILPEILAGHVDMEMIIVAGVYAAVSFIASLGSSLPIVTFGIFLAVSQAAVSSFFRMISGTGIRGIVMEEGVELVMNLIYYSNLAVPIVALL